MKKLLLIVGIVIIIACVLSLLFALLNMYAYYNLRDGSAEHYHRLHQRMIVYFIVGLVLAVLGTVCIIFCLKL